MGTAYDDHSRAERAFGSRDLSRIAPSGPVGTTPWKTAGSWHGREVYDKDAVQSAVKQVRAGQAHLTEVDPRYLYATQPGITRAGVSHYLEHEEPEASFADTHNSGNKYPVIYKRDNRSGNPDLPDWWNSHDHIILSGHHRAAAALLRGEQFKAVLVEGPHGV